MPLISKEDLKAIEVPDGVRGFGTNGGTYGDMAMATIDVLLAINFGAVNEYTCLMYSIGSVPWLETQVKTFSTVHKNDVLQEVKQACLTALLDLYAPFADPLAHLGKSIGLTKAQRIAIMNFNNTTLSEVHTLEAIKLMLLARYHLEDHQDISGPNDYSLTPSEMRQKLVPGNFVNFTMANCTHEFIKYHAMRLWVLYVLAGTDPQGTAKHFRDTDYGKSLLANIPCRTPEGVIGLTSLRKYRFTDKNPASLDYRPMATMPTTSNVADAYIRTLMRL